MSSADSALDRRHDGVRPDPRAEVSELLRKVVRRLTGNARKRAAGIRAAAESVTLRAGRRGGSRALRRNDYAPVRIGLARRRRGGRAFGLVSAMNGIIADRGRLRAVEDRPARGHTTFR